MLLLDKCVRLAEGVFGCVCAFVSQVCVVGVGCAWLCVCVLLFAKCVCLTKKGCSFVG